MDNLDFFERLYKGFEAENLITGRIFACGLEAFKLPADFGFDLLVSNQFELLKASQGTAPVKVRSTAFPYVLQVKSRWTGPLALNESNRYEVAVEFFVNESEFAKITSSDSAFLVCVIFLPAQSGELLNRPILFWADGPWLKCARGCGYLLPHSINGNALLKLTLIYRSNPVVSAAKVLGDLSNEMFDATCKALGKVVLPELEATFQQLAKNKAKSLAGTLPVGYRTKEYLSLRRPKLDFKAGSRDGTHTVEKMLAPTQLDLQHLGCGEKFDQFDDTGGAFIDKWGTEKFV
ncbi:hypothetical protein [Janthinobacterium sp. MDB2-8]|uniref:hypothetical protein n=1 Tax=Janthinobacterium sp. MDB2-8 TaxID=1259338 RepID=UPI003F23CDC1